MWDLIAVVYFSVSTRVLGFKMMSSVPPPTLLFAFSQVLTGVVEYMHCTVLLIQKSGSRSFIDFNLDAVINC